MKKIFITCFYFLLLSLGNAFSEETILLSKNLDNPGFKNLLNAVVRLDVWEGKFEGGRKIVSQSQGSGVIMSAEGHILTNAHVVTNSVERIRVTLATLDRVEARFVNWDHWTDLAVLQLDLEDLKKRGITFTHAEFSPSEALELGRPVWAVGTPYGLTRTLTHGIISNKKRYMEPDVLPNGYESGLFNNWFQTDAPINPGNSGGPLVLEDGRVVGINTQIVRQANNLGFAIPSDVAQSVMLDILDQGAIVRSDIGIRVRPLQDLENFFDSNQTGLLIQNVATGSPGDKAGLRPGDLILSINGMTVDGHFPEQIPPALSLIAGYEPGTQLTLQVLNNKAQKQLTVTTERLESRAGEKAFFEDWGLALESLTRTVAREKKLSNVAGFVVQSVQNAFPAQKAGLQKEDVIISIGGEMVYHLSQIETLYAGYQKERAALVFEVVRGNVRHYLLLKD